MCYCVSLFKKTHYFIRNVFRCEILQSMEQRIIQVETCKFYIDSAFLCASFFPADHEVKKSQEKVKSRKQANQRPLFIEYILEAVAGITSMKCCPLRRERSADL